MNSAVLFSGGKDSVMALYYALNNGDDVKYLLSMKSENDESYMFHVPNIHLTDLQRNKGRGAGRSARCLQEIEGFGS